MSFTIRTGGPNAYKESTRRGGEKLGDVASSHQDLPHSLNMKVWP